jgi:hypothetical protein
MKLSRPVINTIRFDTELELIGNRYGVNTKFVCEAYCLDALNEKDEAILVVGIRIRLSFYVDKEVNEAAGYLSETESTVLIHSTPEQDISMLIRFSSYIFRNIKNNLQRALPAFDLKSLDFPESTTFANALLDGLKQKGLYK